MSTPTPRPDSDPRGWADPTSTYDAVAARYAETFFGELAGKPFDREILTRFAHSAQTGSGRGRPVCDLGCGPGQVGSFLTGAGTQVIGIDRSAGMTSQARRHSSLLGVCRGDMCDLGLLSDSLQGIVCFYSLIHIPRAGVPAVLAECRRVLVAHGSLLIAVHGGEGALHADRMLDHPADLDATLFTLPELVTLLECAGFDMVEAVERAPYETEATQRVYVWASLRN